MRTKLKEIGITPEEIRLAYGQLSALAVKCEKLEEKQNSHHGKLNEIHGRLGNIDINIQRSSDSIEHIIEDMREVKDVIKNNTVAMVSIEKTLAVLITQKATTKENATIAGKFITWVCGLLGAYATYVALKK